MIENIKIEDNYLKQKDFDVIQELFLANNFNWFFKYRFYNYDTGSDCPAVTDNPNTGPLAMDNDKLDCFSFIHTFYDGMAPQSSFFNQLRPILELLRPVSIMKIRANLITRLPNIVENPFHSDLIELSEEKQKQWMTSIFYVNTNDGYTVFEDGTKVESVANRMISFPANMKHTGTACTNIQTRILINFNYYVSGRVVEEGV